jgi:hypothetical protein
MAIRTTIRILLAGAALSIVSHAQSAPPQKPADAPCPTPGQPNTKPATDKPCTPPDAKKPSAAEQFPYPGDPKPAEPEAPAPSSPHSNAAAEHPYPGDSPSMPHDDSTSSSSSSSSSSDGSSSSADPDAPAGPPLNDVGSEGTSTHRRLPKPKKLQTPDERVTEDLSVAKFYEGRGNLQAAYLRTKDAVKTLPDDPESHFALAEVAQKLKKNDEAIAEFQTYLKLEPDGDKVKAAQKALAQLQ